MVKHERLYSVLLAILSVYALCGVALLAALMAIPAGERPPTWLPDWSLPLVTFLNGAYVCAAILALYLRRAAPDAGRRVTRGLNVALLFGPPFGTLLGVYGLWKVDRPAPAAA
jgi:hypothetical protein